MNTYNPYRDLGGEEEGEGERNICSLTQALCAWESQEQGIWQ